MGRYLSTPSATSCVTTQAPVRVAVLRRSRPGVLLLAIVVVALNLRPTITSAPPLLPEIQSDLGLTSAVAGLLTTVPVLCLALFAPLAHRLAHRWGREATTLGAVALIAAGDALRVTGGAPLLFVGTAIAGAGIAMCGVTLPGVVKDLFPERVDTITGAYLVALMLGATIAPVLSVPFRHLAGSWQGSLSSWALPALAAGVLWIPVIRRANEREPREPSRAARLPWRARGAWLLALFMSAQSALAYAYTAWLAPAYHARGWSTGTTGLLLGLLHVAQLATTLVLPLLAARLHDRRPVVVGAVAMTVAGTVWLFAAPEAGPWVATTVLGLGLGGGFSLGLVVLADYAADAGAATRLAAMVFLVCYSVAALAPVVVGALHDATGGFTTPFGLLIAVAGIELALATRLGPAHRGAVR